MSLEVLKRFEINLSAGSSYAYIGAHDLFTIEEGRMVLYSETFIEHPDYRTDQVWIANFTGGNS